MDQMLFFLQKIVKKIHHKEKEIIKWARESVVSTEHIKKNQVLTESNISVKRPAPMKNIIPAKDFFSILGKKASKNIMKDRQLKWNDIK